MCRMSADKNTDLVNELGLARELMLPVDWLKAEAMAGRIPCLRIGRKLRFSVEAVRKSLASRAAESRGVASA